jgi:hypothetical protein
VVTFRLDAADTKLMASVYVHSGAAGAGTGADWANAYTTLAAALTAKAAGDDFWIAHDHAESSAAVQALTSPGTAANPCRVICVNRSGSVPPVSADLRTTGAVTTTGNNGITFQGFAYCYGTTFNAGTGVVGAAITISSSSTSAWSLDACALNKLGTSASSAAIVIGTASANVGSMVTLHNTTVKFGVIGDGITVRGCELIWRHTPSAIQGAALPTTLFASTLKAGVLLEGVDLSALASGKTLVGPLVASSNYIAKDCQLGASVTIAATPSNHGPKVSFVRCDSGDTNYRTERYAYEGTQTTETTIVRTGGASDGTTPISWKLVTTANSKRHLPFEALPISIWNETTGSAITLTIEGIWGGGAVPTNADIWMDVEYLGTSGFPLGSFATSGPADQLAAGTNLSAGSGTWGGSTTKFKLEKTITPQEKGPLTVYVKAALPSSIFFIDPKVTAS